MSFAIMTQLCHNTNLKRDIYRGALIQPCFTFIAFKLKPSKICITERGPLKTPSGPVGLILGEANFKTIGSTLKIKFIFVPVQ